MIIIRYVKIPILVNLSNSVMLTVFILTTVLAQVNTDPWATQFFTITLVGFCIACAFKSINISSMMGMTSMMPAKFMKAFFLGMSISGLFATCLTIITLSIPGADTNQAGFCYFFIATCILTGSVVLFNVFQRMPYVLSYTSQEKLSESEETLKEDIPLPMYKIFLKTYKYAVSSFLVLLVTLAMFPAVMSRLKSSQHGTLWSETYFLPITVFLTYSVGNVLGRVTSSIVQWPSKHDIIYASISRFAFFPLMIMCNLQPRGILPVWFTSDIWPAVFVSVFGWSNGYVHSLAMSYAPQEVEGKAKSSF